MYCTGELIQSLLVGCEFFFNFFFFLFKWKQTYMQLKNKETCLRFNSFMVNYGTFILVNVYF